MVSFFSGTFNIHCIIHVHVFLLLSSLLEIHAKHKMINFICKILIASIFPLYCCQNQARFSVLIPSLRELLLASKNLVKYLPEPLIIQICYIIRMMLGVSKLADLVLFDHSCQQLLKNKLQAQVSAQACQGFH